jgi:hypothetical protein
MSLPVHHLLAALQHRRLMEHSLGFLWEAILLLGCAIVIELFSHSLLLQDNFVESVPFMVILLLG